MTCTTCSGTKLVKTLAPTRWRRLNEGVSKAPSYERKPCPDCTPRPFAEARAQDPRYGQWRDGIAPFEIYVGGHLVCTGTEHVQRENAAEINTAVEQREAKLRAALMEAIDGLGAAAGVINPVVHGATYDDVLDAQNAARAAIEDRYDAVTGDVACGLAFDLGTMQWAQHVLMRAIDALDSGGQVRPFLEAMGLRPAPAPMRVPASVRGSSIEDLEAGALMITSTPLPMTATEVRLRDEQREAEQRQQKRNSRMVDMAFMDADLEPTEERLAFARQVVATTGSPPLSVDFLARCLLEREAVRRRE